MTWLVSEGAGGVSLNTTSIMGDEQSSLCKQVIDTVVSVNVMCTSN